MLSNKKVDQAQDKQLAAAVNNLNALWTAHNQSVNAFNAWIKHLDNLTKQLTASVNALIEKDKQHDAKDQEHDALIQSIKNMARSIEQATTEPTP